MPPSPTHDIAPAKSRLLQLWVAIIGASIIIHLVTLTAVIHHKAENLALIDASKGVPRPLREAGGFHQRANEGIHHLHDAWSKRGGSAKLEFVHPNVESLPVCPLVWIWRFPSAVLPAEDMHSFGMAIRDGWDIPKMYPTSGTAGGAGQFSLSYGNAHSHTSIHMTAFEQGGDTVIHSRAVVIDANSTDPKWSARPAATRESLEDFRREFLQSLQVLCDPHVTAGETPRQPVRYKLSDRPGSSSGSPIRMEEAWSWTVPEEALAPDALGAFVSSIATAWNGDVEIAPGVPYAAAITFGNGSHQASIDVIATQQVTPASGKRETIVHFRSLLFLGKASPFSQLDPVRSLDLAALENIPGSSERERLENARLDGDGRMLKRLREANKARLRTWKLEYNVSFTETPPEQAIDAFATNHGMTWSHGSWQNPDGTTLTHNVRFFKILEFSEAAILATTAIVQEFSEGYDGRYGGWNYASEN